MNLPPAPSSVDVLLFDLGRVVLDINFDSVMANWAGHAGCEPDDLARRFVVDDSFRHHEIGRIDDAAFFASLRQSLGIGITDAQFLEGWNSIFAGEMPGIAPLLANAAKRMPLYAFSNTNPAHIAHFRRPTPTCSAISARYSCPRASVCANPTRKPMITW
jgi:putative hydrolase of the HAD superfamily